MFFNSKRKVAVIIDLRGSVSETVCLAVKELARYFCNRTLGLFKVVVVSSFITKEL